MRLATIRTGGGTAAAVVGTDALVLIDGVPDVGTLLTDESWPEVAARADGERLALDSLPTQAWAPVVPRPGKVLCVGLNYRAHIKEMGRELPEHPTLFPKYAEALIGPYDPIRWSAHSAALDWEAELAVVVGAPVFEASEAEAERAIAGYAVLDDVTLRDYQYHTTQWLPGKNFAGTTPLGPWLTTADAFADGRITTTVNGALMQDSSTADLVFSPAELIGYVSRFLPLAPGDVIATGTPDGVGHARTPPVYLTPGDVVETAVEGLGSLRNVVGG